MSDIVKPEWIFYLVVAIFGITGGWLAANRGRNFIGWCLLCAIFPVFLLVIYFEKPRREVEGKFRLCPNCQEFVKWREPACKYCGTSFPPAA